MPALEDYPPMNRPFRVIDSRILHHLGAGLRLDGLKYDYEGRFEARGKRDYPFIQPVAFSDIESVGPGANYSQTDAPQATQGASPAWDEQTFTFWVWAARENGFYQRDPSGTAYGVMDWVAKIRDAVEMTTDAVPVLDRRLDRTCSIPVQSTVGQNEVSDIGWGVLLDFTCRTDTYCPAGRFAAP